MYTHIWHPESLNQGVDQGLRGEVEVQVLGARRRSFESPSP